MVQFISALRRHLTWALTADTGFACAKRLLKSWQRSEPVECRTAVPLHISLAITTKFAETGNHAAATIVILCFHCLCRLEEVMFVTWRDLTSASLYFRLTYPHVFGVVRIKRPKLRLGIGRHNHHFPFFEDPGVANYFDWLTAPLDDAELDANIWPTGASGFLPRWKSAARVLHVSSLNLVLAGLRAGGVTHHFLNVGLLRRGARTTCTRRHLLCRALPCLEKQSSASLSAASASIPCAACGHARPWVWCGALRSVSADFEV